MTQRIQLRRTKGWRMPPNTVKVDRTTKWGNPFIVGIDGTAQHCVGLFALMLGGYLCVSSKAAIKKQADYVRHARENIHKLRGKNLACWCKPGKECHADILLEVARAQRLDDRRDALLQAQP